MNEFGPKKAKENVPRKLFFDKKIGDNEAIMKTVKAFDADKKAEKVASGGGNHMQYFMKRQTGSAE